jgi:hypothetical protein
MPIPDCGSISNCNASSPVFFDHHSLSYLAMYADDDDDDDNDDSFAFGVLLVDVGFTSINFGFNDNGDVSVVSGGVVDLL